MQLTSADMLALRIATIHYASEMRIKGLDHTADNYRRLYRLLKDFDKASGEIVEVTSL